MKSEVKIRTLYVFDFDGTLINTPNKEEGIIMYKKITGNDYPHIGWVSKPESLMLDYDIQPIEDVYSKYIIAKEDEHADIILLSNRMYKLEPQIRDIMDLLEINIDRYLLKNDNRNKAQRLFDILKEYPDVTTIHFYDDVKEHIDIFDNFNFGAGITLFTYHIKSL